MTQVDEQPAGNPAGEASLISHLLELRTRLMYAGIAIIVLFFCLWPFSDQLFSLAAAPLIAQMPEDSTMIATQVASPFLTPFKLSMVAAVFLAMPVILYQIWAFVSPGLYQREKRFTVPLLISSILLFYLGVAFSSAVVCPLWFASFNAVAPEGVAQFRPDGAAKLEHVEVADVASELETLGRVSGDDRVSEGEFTREITGDRDSVRVALAEVSFQRPAAPDRPPGRRLPERGPRGGGAPGAGIGPALHRPPDLRHHTRAVRGAGRLSVKVKVGWPPGRTRPAVP